MILSLESILDISIKSNQAAPDEEMKITNMTSRVEVTLVNQRKQQNLED